MPNPSPSPVYLQLLHGENYIDLASGVRFTKAAPVQAVSEAHARRLLKEIAPQYNAAGESRPPVRRFRVADAPPSEARDVPEPEPQPPASAAEPTDDEIDEELRASREPSAPVEPPPASDAAPASPVRPRARLPRTPSDG